MEIKLTLEPKELGKELAAASDADQAEFFNSFGYWLMLGTKSFQRREMQFAYITDLLDASGRDCFIEFGGMIEVVKEERAKK